MAVELMKAISLFSGAGGMDVGFVNAGVEIVWANEMNSDAAQTYRLNHNAAVLYEGDIRLAKENLCDVVGGSIDLVFGGPPCQGFSVAGKMNPDDRRSKLIWEFMDVIKAKTPSVFVMENVKALGELQRWENIRTGIVNLATELGYSCFYKVLNAANFGVPQKRERVFFIGYRGKNKDAEQLFDKALEQMYLPKKKLRDCLCVLPSAGSEENPITCTAKISVAANPVLRKSPYAGMLFNGLGRPLDLDGQANTLPASMGGNKTPILDEHLLENPEAESWVVNYHKALCNGCVKSLAQGVPPYLRRITTLEAATIQTFPADYQFYGEKSSVYRQIGNAVPCEFAEAVAATTLSAQQKM